MVRLEAQQIEGGHWHLPLLSEIGKVRTETECQQHVEPATLASPATDAGWVRAAGSRYL